MKKYMVIILMLITLSLIFAACASQTPDTSESSEVSGSESGSTEIENSGMSSDTEKGINRFPASLTPIPDSYLTEAEQQGTLQDLYYDTYESFSYNEKSQRLQKHAVVYLPNANEETNKLHF